MNHFIVNNCKVITLQSNLTAIQPFKGVAAYDFTFLTLISV